MPALGVLRGDVAGAVGDAAQRREAAIVLLVALHQPRRRLVEQDGDLALLHLAVLGVEQADAVARRLPAHAAGLHRLAREIAELQRGLGLAVALAHGHAPDALDMLDHLGVQRLAGRAQFPQRAAIRRHVLLHQHAPDRGRRAEGLHAVRRHGLQRGLGVEAWLVVHEDGRAGIPGREEAGIGVLGPARGGDIQVHVPGLQADPVHRDQVPDRVGGLVVQNELRLRRSAGGEIQQHGVGRRRRPVRREFRAALHQRGVVGPARSARADRDARDRGIEPVELARIRAVGDDMPDPTAGEAVPKIGRRQQRRRRDHHGAELHRRQHGLPQRHDIAEHQQDPVAAPDAQVAQPVRQAAGIGRELGEAAGGGGVADDAERLGIAQRPAGKLGIEPVQRVVEMLHARPTEAAMRAGIILAMREEEVARLPECLAAHPALLPSVCACGAPLPEG